MLHFDAHAGSGPHLLLVHGMLASRAQWLANLAALSRVSRPVVVELYGHGRSPSPEDSAAYHPDAYVAEFERIRVAVGAERWAICGQSLGAALTLRYALECRDRVIAQVFTNSNSALADAAAWGPAVRGSMQAMAKAIEARGRAALEAMPIHPARATRIPAGVKAALVADCALHDPVGIARTGLHTVPESSVRARFGDTRVPTLLVVGEREERFADHRRFAESALQGLRVVALDAGHAVNAEASAEFDAAVVGWLNDGAEPV